ncbi:phosphoribosylaminoimidazole carboxylase, chloroplastic-like isoform X3 [Camellia sinensis]|uniref:phosphoribosylaminoimidazole carboxylase, chloroplastic-like isoform X3 n=1 Tax=Camellia sinensis TaxID=4442 RepID=UPI001036909E|nr:phosphoribosylaminoimidazole carboxylase, chloroplastic-like isoform X3 [Camellia sinensis]
MQIYDFESAKRVGELFVYPLMIKSRRLAYDGRGNVVAKSEEEISFAVNVFGGYDRALYVEKWAPFVKVYVASNLQLIGLKIYLYGSWATPEKDKSGDLGAYKAELSAPTVTRPSMYCLKR